MSGTAALPSSLTTAIASLSRAITGGRPAEAAVARYEFERLLRETPRNAEVRPTLVPVLPEGLPRSPGIYVIGVGQMAYVGLALDIHHRFHNREYGHLTEANKTRSRLVLAMPDPSIFVCELEEPPREPTARRDWLSMQEIEAYARLVVAGYTLTNAMAMLGRASDVDTSPVLACDLDTGAYILCESIAAAVELVGSTAVPAVLHGYQRTALGFAARWATDDEAEAVLDRVDESGWFRGPELDAAVTAVGHSVELTGTGRYATYSWTQGPLSQEDRARLRRFSRSSYKSGERQTEFLGIDPIASGGWQFRAKKGPTFRELCQVRRREWSELDAAIAREERIRSEGWEPFNTGRYGSNAQAINRRLGRDAYAPW